MKLIEKKIRKVSTKYYMIVFVIALLSLIMAYSLSSSQSEKYQSTTVNLITNNVGEWNFVETSQGSDENGINIHAAYYNKSLSNSRNEESMVEIHVFANSLSVKNELKQWSDTKTCRYVKEKISNVIIFECYQSGVWWASNNLLIHIGGSPRTSGTYVDAYDLIVCPLSGCEYEYKAYVPKAVFDAYIEKYPAN